MQYELKEIKIYVGNGHRASIGGQELCTFCIQARSFVEFVNSRPRWDFYFYVTEGLDTAYFEKPKKLLN